MSPNCKLHLLSAAWHGCDREMLRSTFERRTVPSRHLYIFIKGPATAAESPLFPKITKVNINPCGQQADSVLQSAQHRYNTIHSIRALCRTTRSNTAHCNPHRSYQHLYHTASTMLCIQHQPCTVQSTAILYRAACTGAGYFFAITSTPINGLSTSGTTTLPSAC